MSKEECEAKINALFQSHGLLDTIRQGNLDTQKLDELAHAIGALNVLDLEFVERARLASHLWEFAFHVSNCIACHHNKMDIFSFTNVDGSQLRALNNMVYWLANRFTYAKEIEMSELYFAGYMRWDGFDPSVPFDPNTTH